MLSITLGIDISKDKLDVALYQAEHYHLASFSNDKDGYRRLRKWLKKHKGQEAAVCIEATGRYGDGVSLYLHECGYKVSVVNPARIKAYGASQLKRNKTDSEDAKTIAHFCATQKPDAWTPPSAELQELQALSRYLDTLKEDRTRELNRRQSGLTVTVVLETIEEHVAFLDEQIYAIEQKMYTLIKRDPDLQQKHELLESISGIGKLTAAKFLAEVPDVSRFDSAAQLAAYAGLTPRQHKSGSSVHRPAHLSKTGNSRFRTIFFMPALSAMQNNPITKALAKRLADRGKTRMTIVGAVMRKLVHLAYGVLKNKRPFDPNYLVNVQITA